MLRSVLVRAAVVMTIVGLGACTTTTSPSTTLPSSAASGSTAASSGEGTAIEATLTEFEVTLSATTAPAGTVTFNVTNDGTQTHEFVVLQTDTPAADLPVEDNVVPEDQVEVVNEIEDLEAGSTETLDVDLEAGHYVIICNVEGHYMAGMSTDFTVE